jgi:hypothetical protein
MYRKSKNETQLNAFSSVTTILESAASKQYSDTGHWHNQFREQVLMRIDEEIFKVLYSDKMGAPNASIRTLIGMMILKEAYGWSDSQLFENCRFNLLTRSALGLYNVNDPIPVESTYYLLRKRMYDYHKQKGEDLLDKAFKSITAEQIKSFEVSGRSIRMDSKLIGSNIAYFTRYEIIHYSFCCFYKAVDKESKSKLRPADIEELEALFKEESGKTVYRSTKDEIKARLQTMGVLIYKVLNVFSDNESEQYQTLRRVFSEQYRILDNEQIEVRPKEEISSQSVQSPYDTDCTYRNKNEEPVKGYSVNITETCDKEQLSLITDVQVENASIADNQFVITAVENTKQVLGHKVDNCHADGAFNSPDNVEYFQNETANFYLTGIQGRPSRYELIPNEESLVVIDTQTNQSIPVTKAKNNKWRIATENGYRYFSQDEIKNCLLRQQINSYPEEIRNVRCNVEASIFQLCFYSRNNKTRFRSKIKNKMWAILRSLWINLVRIVKFCEKICQRTSSSVENSTQFSFFYQKVIFLSAFFKKFFIMRFSFLNRVFKSKILEIYSYS